VTFERHDVLHQSSRPARPLALLRVEPSLTAQMTMYNL
jgi:hypothetical protein